MKPVVVLASFERSLKRLDPQDQEKVIAALEDFLQSRALGALRPGHGFKKLDRTKYEFRVDIRLRVLLREVPEAICLFFVGGHDDVRRLLKAG